MISKEQLHEAYHNYILYACGYYCYQTSLVTDKEFDELATFCLKNRGAHKTIFHKYVKPRHLKAATYSEKKEDYPMYFRNHFEK